MVDLFTDQPLRGADVSECGQFRYLLWRSWGPGRRLLFIMLNPSTADADQDDPTIRKCMGFARRLKFDGIEVVNLFAFRATDPRDLACAGHPEGPANNEAIASAGQRCIDTNSTTVCAWGANARQFPRRTERVRTSLALAGVRLRALRLLKDGTPEHPLMLPYSCSLVPLA